MDTLTHIALGACIGEAFLGKKIGRKAMLWGALAQSVPDIDFLASLWMNTTSNLLAHRGFTHSILFAIGISVFLALLAEKLHRPHNIRLHTYLVFFVVEVFVHIFLDAFNNYGVGWFEPFSQYRVSFNTMYVADPFFSVWAGIAFLGLVLAKRRSPRRKYWWMGGVLMCSGYLAYGIVNKLIIDEDVRKAFRQQKVPFKHYFTTPAPLQNWVWYVVAGDDQGYYTGYRSVFDRTDTLALEYFPRNTALLDTFKQSLPVQQLIRFSKGYYTVENWGDTLVFNDLRFGQVIGWHYPRERFAFHYYLNLPDENTLVVQRGRFAKWNWRELKLLAKRVKGK